MGRKKANPAKSTVAVTDHTLFQINRMKEELNHRIPYYFGKGNVPNATAEDVISLALAHLMRYYNVEDEIEFEFSTAARIQKAEEELMREIRESLEKGKEA